MNCSGLACRADARREKKYGIVRTVLAATPVFTTWRRSILAGTEVGTRSCMVAPFHSSVSGTNIVPEMTAVYGVIDFNRTPAIQKLSTIMAY